MLSIFRVCSQISNADDNFNSTQNKSKGDISAKPIWKDEKADKNEIDLHDHEQLWLCDNETQHIKRKWEQENEQKK